MLSLYDLLQNLDTCICMYICVCAYGYVDYHCVASAKVAAQVDFEL